jgi:hypothetical protein
MKTSRGVRTDRCNMTPVDNKDLGFDPNVYDTNPVEVAYRRALADALERILDQGADTLADIVSGMNDLSVAAPDGRSWSEETFESEMRRLGQ